MPYAFKKVEKTSDTAADEEKLEALEASGWEVYDRTGSADEYRLRRPYDPAPNVPATDAARRLARAEGVSLQDVDGSGEDGQIIVKDVRGALSDATTEAE